jgi:hypothetical protein
MNDQCSGITDIPPSDIFSKTSELAEKLGASEKCTKEIETMAAHYSASLDAKASLGVVSGETKAQTSGGADYMKGSQSGCTPLVLAAQKIITNSKKIQCILQKNSTDSTINMSSVNSIQFKPLPFTESEIANNAQQITQFLTDNPRNKFILDMQKQQNDLFQNLLLAGKSVSSLQQLTAIDFGNTWDASFKSFQNAQKRNITLKNVKISQSIGGKIKIIQQLSTQAQAEISDLLKQTAAATTEAGLALKLGSGALEPSGKAISDTSIEQNQNLSSSSVNAKVTNVKQTLTNNNLLEFSGPGEVLLENTTIDQNIMLNVITEMLISDAISAGIKSQSVLEVDSKTMSALQAEVKGVNDMIKEQGDANEKAIQANNIGFWSSLFSLGFFFLFLKKDNLDPSFKQLFIVLSIVCFGFALFLFYIFFEAFISSFSTFLGVPKPAFESTLNRPLIIYQNLLKSFNCNKILTVKNVLVWDTLDDVQARLEIEKFAKNYCSL